MADQARRRAKSWKNNLRRNPKALFRLLRFACGVITLVLVDRCCNFNRDWPRDKRVAQLDLGGSVRTKGATVYQNKSVRQNEPGHASKGEADLARAADFSAGPSGSERVRCKQRQSESA